MVGFIRRSGGRGAFREARWWNGHQVSGQTPDEIWEQALDEGERRLSRTPLGLSATGFAGGVEVAFGILGVTLVSSVVALVAPDPLAHVVGSLAFGIAFVLITLGRAELFTENFLLPVAAVYARRATMPRLLGMWGITLVLNLVGVAGCVALFTVHGVLDPGTLHAGGLLADTYGLRATLPAFVSAVLAGVVMTVFTWVVVAAESAASRVLVSLLVGFLLAGPSLNHAVVAFGKISFGLIAGTTDATVGDLVRNTLVAIAGNLVGGIGFVFASRIAQVRGEPAADSGFRPGPDGRSSVPPGRPGLTAGSSTPPGA
jgi:formate/nitrite transporter FocA (FNT family)